MTESTMRRRVVQALRSQHAIAVENPAFPGTPDVNYVEGWLELKHADLWPVREKTRLAMPHFTPQQRVWLMKRHYAGGNAHLLLQVSNDWLLLDAITAARLLGKVSKSALEDAAIARFKTKDLNRELPKCLSRLLN